MSLKTIEIFRAGRHTAMSGETLNFTTSDLDQIVRDYNPKKHEAPLVVGHPTHDAPAFGWVKALRRKGKLLLADVGQVQPSFAERVRSGEYKKISASFYKPGAPGNPSRGYSLRHVGMLGGMPPAVKGLQNASFAGDVKSHVSFEFASAELAGKLRSFAGKLTALLASLGGDNAEAAALSAEIEELATEAAAEPDAATELEASSDEVTNTIVETVVDEVTGALPDDLPDETVAQIEEAVERGIEEGVARATAELDTADHAERARGAKPRMGKIGTALRDRMRRRGASREAQQFAERERERERAWARREIETFLDGLLAEGRPVPALRADVISLCETLAASSGAASFSEGKSALDIFKGLLKGLPKQVHFGEVASFAGEQGESPRELGRRANQYQAEQAAKGIHMTTSEALAAVKGNR